METTNFFLEVDETFMAKWEELRKTVKENWELCDELRKHYDEVFDFNEQSNFIKVDGTKMKINERICEVVWEIEEELKENDPITLINNNKDNATIQAIIAWKIQQKKCRELQEELDNII